MPKSVDREVGIRLREPRGWFAAGEGFRTSLNLLSYGAFKLYAYLSIEADRRTGAHRTTHGDLAGALGKSKRIIGRYVRELEAKGVCQVHHGKNQYAVTRFEIMDRFWPYHRVDPRPSTPNQVIYIESVRQWFIDLGCTSGGFSSADQQTAERWEERHVALGVVQDALLLGACRKYSAWLGGEDSSPIRNLCYFESLIKEIQDHPLPPGYSEYLRSKIGQLAAKWGESAKLRDQVSTGERKPNASVPGESLTEAIAQCWRKKITSTRTRKPETR